MHQTLEMLEEQMHLDESDNLCQLHKLMHQKHPFLHPNS